MNPLTGCCCVGVCWIELPMELKNIYITLHKVTPPPTMTTQQRQLIFCCKPGAVRGAETNCHLYYYTTWLRHRCAPGKISACAPGCCTQLPHRRQNRLFPWRRCSTGCCGTDVPGIRTPTPVSGGSWEQFCQPCPHFRVCLSVAITKVCWYSVIHQKGFILSPCVTLVPLAFHQSRESAEIRHFCELISSRSDKMNPLSLCKKQVSTLLYSLWESPCTSAAPGSRSSSTQVKSPVKSYKDGAALLFGKHRPWRWRIGPWSSQIL